MLNDPKSIFILIGPKGSGKSFIGRLIEKRFQIHFIPVEQALLNFKSDDKLKDEEYHAAVYQRIEALILAGIAEHSSVSFESTGISHHFDQLLAKLKTQHHVVLIRVQADDAICISRISSRDQSQHIPLKESEILMVNELSRKRDFDFDLSINNNQNNADAIELLLDESSLFHANQR